MNHQESQTDPCHDVIDIMNQELSDEQLKSNKLQKKIKEYELELARSYWIDNIYHYVLSLYIVNKGIIEDYSQFKNIAIQPYDINDITRIYKSQCHNLLLEIKETRYLSDTIGRRRRHNDDYELIGKELLSEVLDNKYKRELWQ
jgi:hypothetical protein